MGREIEKTPEPAYKNKYSGPIGRIRFGVELAWRVASLAIQTVRHGYDK